MLVLLFATAKLIQTCEYHCQTCDSLKEFCSSFPATRTLHIDEKESTYVCANKILQMIGVLVQFIKSKLECPSNCVNCDPYDPSKLQVVEMKTLLIEFQTTTKFVYVKNGILKFGIHIIVKTLYFIIKQIHLLLTDYLRTRLYDLEWTSKQWSNLYQLISKLESNKIMSTTTPYPFGQSIMEKIDNLFAWGIKMNHGSTMVWAANIHYSYYQQYSGMRIVNQNQWEFVIYQFLIQKYEGNVFLQIALSENKNINSENQNRLLDTTEGNMALCYYLAYEYNGFLFNLKLEEIIDDILYILSQRPSNSLDYFYNGQNLTIKQCQPNYILKNEECICDNENGYSIYNNICQLQCPIDCITLTKEVCLLADHSIRCQQIIIQMKNQTCQTCINEKECTKCKSGLIISNSQCLTCQEFSKQRNCEQYLQQLLMQKCLDGYQLDQIDQCIQCSLNCKFCNFKDQCTICKDDYYLISDSCIQCMRIVCYVQI